MMKIEILKTGLDYEVYMNIDGNTYGATQHIATYGTARKAMLKAVKIKDEIPFLKINIDKETAHQLGGWSANWNVEVI